MTISFDNINTRSYTAIILMLLILFSCSLKAEDDITQQLLQCREETSALIRLDCYDNTLKSKYGDLEKQKKPIFSSEIAARILAQEKERNNEDIDHFIMSEAQGAISKEIILTIPALGVKPPRPVLAFSCLDHITRMQIVLFQPQPNSSRQFTLKTNTNINLNVSWFIRDDGYLLESSRGLPVISQIQRLFNAETIYIESDNPYINGLSFNIHNLAQEITPLRQACRW